MSVHGCPCTDFRARMSVYVDILQYLRARMSVYVDILQYVRARTSVIHICVTHGQQHENARIFMSYQMEIRARTT